MKNRSQITRISHLFILFNFILLFLSCSTSEMKVSEFEFQYNNKTYIIRSAYCPGNPESCNQIIGEDLIAVDQNQDRIIDKIIKGNISYFEAQKIYDHCLNYLEKQNKLNTVNSKTKTFTWKTGEFTYEIKTLHNLEELPLNEFSIIDPTQNRISVFMDRNADGILDEILRGEIELNEAQKTYKKIISLGLIEKTIVKRDSQFFISD